MGKGLAEERHPLKQGLKTVAYTTIFKLILKMKRQYCQYIIKKFTMKNKKYFNGKTGRVLS